MNVKPKPKPSEKPALSRAEFFGVGLHWTKLLSWSYTSASSVVTNTAIAPPRTWLLYQSSPSNSYSPGEVTTIKTINYRNGTHHAPLTSHYVRVTGQIPSTSVHVSTATTADFTSDIYRPRLTSPSTGVFPFDWSDPFSPPDTPLYTLLFIRTSFHKRTAVGLFQI